MKLKTYLVFVPTNVSLPESVNNSSNKIQLAQAKSLEKLF